MNHEGYFENLREGLKTEAVAWRCSVKKMFLKILQNSHEALASKPFFLRRPATLIRPGACNLIRIDTLTQVFSCEFCEIFKNTFFI